MPNQKENVIPELDVGSGASGSSGGPTALDRRGNRMGPFQLSTKTPRTSTPLSRGDKSKVNGLQVGNFNSFEFKAPCIMQDISTTFEVNEINTNMEKPNYMENQVQEPSQSMTKLVHDYSYARDCTIFGESEFETDRSFSFEEPICANIDTKSFESTQGPISVKPSFSESFVLLNDGNYSVQDKKERNEQGEHEGPQGAKRKEREGGDGKELVKKKRESRVPRGPKMTFAEATKGLEVVEVRSSTGVDNLQQDDWELIESQLLFRFAAITPKPVFQYGVEKLGCSQGGVWIACNGTLTVDFVLQTVPDIQSPIGKFYTYKVFAPGSKPFVYYKARFAKRFWCDPKELVQLIKRLNWSLDFKVDCDDDSDIEETGERSKNRIGGRKDVHMRVSSGMRDPNKDIKHGFFTVTLECDERLSPYIIQMNGVINLGATKVEMYGGGLDKAIQDEKEKEKHDKWAKDKEEKDKEDLLNEEYNKGFNKDKEDEKSWEVQVEEDLNDLNG